MKNVCCMSLEDREFVLRLLHMTKDDFRSAFHALAKSDSLKGMRRFVSHWCELAELVFTEAEAEWGENTRDIMKKICLMDGDDRQFARELLRSTKDDFERAFQDIARTDSQKGIRKFADSWCALAGMAFVETVNRKTEEGGEV